MSRRGKNNVKRAIVREATSSLFGDAMTSQPKIATNNFNPLFHYLQMMFPNYDNAVLHSVLEQEGNSIERAIEVLLTFAEEPKTKEPETVDNNIDFFDDFSDTDLPPNVFALPVPPSQNSGRDHVSLYEHQKQRKNKKSQRARRRQALQKQQLLQEHKKKVKWVPLQDYVIEQRNPFGVLDELPPVGDAVEEKNLPLLGDADEAQTLLTQEEIEESWKQFEEATAVAQEEIQVNTQSASSSDFGEEWSDYAPPADEFSSLSADETSGVDEFVVIDEEQQQQEPLVDSAVFESADEFGSREQQVVVKLYYSPSDIHRLGLKRSALTFAKLYDHAEAYLNGKCQQVAKSALPRAFALTYVDDEADTIHLCSEEELAEALRLHEEVFWVDGKQPVLRLHIKALEVAVHGGHLIVGA